MYRCPLWPTGGGRPGPHGTVPTPAQRHSATLLGACHLRPPRGDGNRAARGPSKPCLACLPHLHHRCPDALLSVRLAQAPRPPSRAVQRWLTPQPGGGLEPREPYAPAYHPRARCWQWLTATVDGATACDTMEDVCRQSRQRIWHDHEGGLTATIHCDFTLYREIL